LAGSAVETWKGIANSRAAAKGKTQMQSASKADFSTLLARVNSASPAALQGQATLNQQGVQSELAALPEVRAALASSSPGTQVKFAMSGQGLSRVSPNSMQQAIALSPASQNAVRSLAAAMNSGAAPSMTLTA
jgi:hypothetical protein